jgi:hypothetical protein
VGPWNSVTWGTLIFFWAKYYLAFILSVQRLVCHNFDIAYICFNSLHFTERIKEERIWITCTRPKCP